MPVVLLLLNPYVDAILVLALGICIGGIMASLNQYLEKIPWIGGAIANAATSMAQGIRNAAGSILRPIDHAVGGTLHAVARLVDWTYGTFRRHADLLLQVASFLPALALAVAHLRTLVHRIVTSHTGIEGAVKTLEKEYHGIEHRVKSIEHDIAKGIGSDVRVSVRALEKWEKAAKGQLAADERAITQTLPGELTKLENFIKAIPGTNYLDWAAGIVTAALGLGVVSLFKCPTFLNKTLGRGCGLWNGIEDLFGLFIDTLLLTNVCTILPFLETAVSDVADPIVIALTDVGAGLCSGGIGAAPALQVPALSLPANPGFTLSIA